MGKCHKCGYIHQPYYDCTAKSVASACSVAGGDDQNSGQGTQSRGVPATDEHVLEILKSECVNRSRSAVEAMGRYKRRNEIRKYDSAKGMRCAFDELAKSITRLQNQQSNQP